MSRNAADRIQNWMINHPASYSQPRIDAFPSKILTVGEKKAVINNVEQGIIVNRLRLEKHITRREALDKITTNAERRVSREIITIRGHKLLAFRDAKGRYTSRPKGQESFKA